MSFMLWDANAPLGIASGRRVLRAHEVPVATDAQGLVTLLSERLARADDDAREAREAARQAGHDDGLRQAQLDNAQALAQRLLALEHEAQQREARRDADVARLALAVVRKLLGDWPEPVQLAAAAAHAARELAPRPVLKVYVPIAALEAARAHAAQHHPLLRDAQWHADPALAEGACRIETELGAVDVGPVEQLARLAGAWGVEAS